MRNYCNRSRRRGIVPPSFNKEGCYTPYIEFEEFKDFTGKTDDFKAAFEKHLSKVTAVLDSITSYFYQFNKIEEDPIGSRVRQFKLALCSRIIYFDEVGADIYESINNTSQGFSAGRASISNSNRYNPSGKNESKLLVAEDIYIYLEGTGLLYRGVPSW